MNTGPRAGAAETFDIVVRRKVHRAVDGDAIVAIEDVRLSLPQGGFVALIGPSGCGKTSLLRIAAGLDTDFVGTLSKPAGLRLAVVFQEPRLLPWRTVAQNIDLARPSSMRNDTAELAERLGFTAVLSRYPSELSLGLARRVSLARALAIHPALLLLDEPFVSLDAAAADALRDVVAEAARRLGTTVLMVTHDVIEAIGLADRLVILSERPARILDQISLSPPRGRRSRQDVEAILAQVAEVQATSGS